MHKKVITLKCKAKNAHGHICGRQFIVEMDIKRTVYPKYCETHANSYKRQRYLLSGDKTCRR